MPDLINPLKNDTDTIRHAGAFNAYRNGSRRQTSVSHYGGDFGSTNRCMIAVVVYLALLLDNILLTVIVPILPNYLAFINKRVTDTQANRFADTDTGTSKFDLNQASFIAYRSHHTDTISSAHPSMQTVLMTKHPIPGKSMINFLIPQSIDGKVAHHSLEQRQQKQKYLIDNGNNNSTDIIVPNSSDSIIHLHDDSDVQATIASSSPRTPTIKTAIDDADNLNDENGSIGLLLAMKALVQLLFNPIVGNMSSKFGYRFPIVIGTFCLLISSLIFVVGDTYTTLLLGRAVHGIGSACIGVCGMSLVAQHYPEEERRSKVMGIILGSIALGVLIGYPFGGFLYDLSNKSAPFIIISILIFLNLGTQLIVMDLSLQPEVIPDIDHQKPKWKPLFKSKMILAIIVAIWFSTSTMAILEPCLPIWLIQHIKPTKWQLGTVFIPDSVGYFVGTNFFGSIAYKYGQIKISCISLLLVGLSAVLIPIAKTVVQLLLPHFCLGLGIGIIDAALVPLLATFVDATLTQDELNELDCSDVGTVSMSSYGTVYCLQQTSVSLAYFLAPLVGGELAEAFGFTWLMRIVGFCNIVYGPILVYLYHKYDPKTLREKHNELLLINTDRSGSQYKQLYNSLDTE